MVLNCHAFNILVIFMKESPVIKRNLKSIVVQPNSDHSTMYWFPFVVQPGDNFRLVFMFYSYVYFFRSNYLSVNANFGPCSQEPAVWFVSLHLPFFYINYETHDLLNKLQIIVFSQATTKFWWSQLWRKYVAYCPTSFLNSTPTSYYSYAKLGTWCSCGTTFISPTTIAFTVGFDAFRVNSSSKIAFSVSAIYYWGAETAISGRFISSKYRAAP